MNINWIVASLLATPTKTPQRQMRKPLDFDFPVNQVLERTGAVKGLTGRNPWGKPTGLLAAARQLAGAYGSAGFRVLNEYEKPVPWATGGHLHVEWSPGQDREAMLNRVRKIASDEGYDIHLGGLTAQGHRGRAHKELRAADISAIRRR